MNASTRLVGSLPELDSMAVVELVVAIEERFGFEVRSADITIDTSRRWARLPLSSTPTGHDGVAWIAASSGLSVRPQIYRGRSQL